MPRELSDLSREELWQLFPIELREYDPQWTTWYAETATDLMEYFGGRVSRINHIGSTAVPGLIAKPTVDILLEISELTDADTDIPGWILMHQGENNLVFNRGYTPAGFAQQVFHLHLRPRGDHDELYFRDYLRTHPDIAKSYVQLKQELAEKFRHHRDNYTEAKGTFIQEVTARARKEFGPRYA